MTRTVLISGASISGPTLAYWLHRHGFRPIVVERAATVRGGGYPIDVRATAIDVADRMGLLPALRDAHIDTQRVTFVDARGGGDPAAAFAGYERVMRPYAERNQDLARHGGAALIPRTRTMLWLRNRLLTVLPRLGPAARLLNGRINQAARSFPLHDYASGSGMPTARPELDGAMSDSDQGRAKRVDVNELTGSTGPVWVVVVGIVVRGAVRGWRRP